MAWNSADENGNGQPVVILPDGTEKKVESDAPFARTIRDIARAARLSKFTVFVDEDEIDSSEAPDDFEDIEEVELKKYDEGA